MRRSVNQVNRLMMPTSAAISTASHQWKRQASSRPQATPMGVMTNNSGFAILMKSKDVAGKVLVFCEVPEMVVDILRIDFDGRATLLSGVERHALEQPLHHGVQATRADVLGLLVDAER